MSAFLAALALGQIVYPPARKEEVVDDYHGTKIEDPYRWLEQPIDAQEVRDWVTAENKITFDYLNAIDGRDRLLKQIQSRINFERFGIPSKVGSRTVYTRNDGLQNQDVLYVVDKPGAKPRVLLDPNKLSKDGTTGLSTVDFSADGKRMMYGLTQGGSDWIEWKIRDVATGKDLSTSVKWSKFGVGTINRDGSGIYYLRYPQPKEGEALTQANNSGAIYFHKVGTSQSEDQVILELKDQPDTFLAVSLDSTKTLLEFYVQPAGTINNAMWVMDLKKPGSPMIKLFDEVDAQYGIVGREGDTVYVQTSKDAPRGKILAAALLRRIAPRVVIPQSKDTLQGAVLMGGKLIASYLRDAHAAVDVYSTEGKKTSSWKLPGLGTVALGDAKTTDTSLYYSYTDFFSPSTIYEYKLSTGRSSLYRKPKLAFDTNKYEAKQVFYASKDGTKVPMFLVHKKGMKLNGQNPTILYGYGGFGSSQVPWFSASRTVWMDMGGVFAVACIRGGGEYGEDWHRAAIKQNRQKAYDDFIAAGEWLAKSGYANNKHLAIMGGSNGGLLVGACMIQRPELFAVAIPQVGVMDMLRFNQFTIGKAWESDYGSPQNPSEFASLLKISPYHTLKEGVSYPATLVTTADRDDRVVPAHSFKFAARLQEVHAGKTPVLIRVETTSGHGASNLSKSLEEIRDIYAFTLKNMGRSIPAKL